MNYRKLIKGVIYGQKDNNLTAFALLAGLAAGAAIAVLLAPRSGRESRLLLAKTFNPSKEQGHHQELKDQLLDDLRETNREHADQLQGPENKRKDTTKIKVPSAGTTAWKKQAVKA